MEGTSSLIDSQSYTLEKVAKWLQFWDWKEPDWPDNCSLWGSWDFQQLHSQNPESFF